MPTPDDQLDGCDLARDMSPLPEKWLPWEVLFASVRWQGLVAVHKRAAEWRELFGGT